MATYPVRVPALRVDQPLGSYFVAALPAHVLLDVAVSKLMTATLDSDGNGYSVDDTQRPQQAKRLLQIADYIDREDAAFPNAIILAANIDVATELQVDDVLAGDEIPNAAEGLGADRSFAVWTVEQGNDGCYTLVVPSRQKLAVVIDGQHRLFAFARATQPRLNMQLICSVFLDLPKPYQAQLFATINSTQKPVDKSLTYELFGYNVADEPSERWTPDKLAVFLTRKLNTDEKSPLRGRVLVAPKRDPKLLALNDSAPWKVSTAVVVEGILRLISSNPKADSNEMMTSVTTSRRALHRNDRSPLRNVYKDGNDNLLYTLVLNYLTACETSFWARANRDSFITRTVGVQALFDILRQLAGDAVTEKDISSSRFSALLAPATDIDFSADVYRNASGSGRSIIRRAIAAAIGLSTGSRSQLST